MKNIIKNITLCGCLVLGMGMTSCEDMMTVDTGDKAYINANDTLYSYLGIMRAMQDVAERQIVLGEIRGDLVSSSEYATDTLHAISNFENPKDQIIFIAETAREKQALELKKRIEEKFAPKEVIVNTVHPQNGINIGPGLCAAYYFGTEISKDLSIEKEYITQIISKK